LTEPGSGSDALAAKTKAVLSADGKHYVLNGSKMWITNAGFADIAVLFAKIDGDKFTGFIIERNMPGFQVNKEEHKMGLKGSSTCALTLQDVKVPVENVLGEIGRGHKIAFNILNIGRFKLGAGALGAAKEVLRTTLQYTAERKQFDTKLQDFPLIMSKLADMAVQIYVGESMVYRTAGLVDGGRPHAKATNADPLQERLASIEEYAVECSMLKVGCSEILDFVVDEGVQCHGGYGYSAEYPVERFYRDSRINRIFEGTNEINRMLIPGMLVKRAMKGELPLLSEIQKIQAEMLDAGGLEEPDGSPLAAEKKLLDGGRKLALLLSGAAFQAFGEELKSQQEVLAHIADLCITLYGAESAVIRALKCAGRGSAHAKLAGTMARIAVNDAAVRFEQSARSALPAMMRGDELKILLSAVKRLTRFAPLDAIALRHEVAQEVKKAGRYFL
ncbi:MAG TPA: acyl-CoA dehydrogenase family protein, partial [Planctomycetota bacterium]|nr:acyl-CoA dehydrogenase family protein [Planctomycetota bacterium]